MILIFETDLDKKIVFRHSVLTSQLLCNLGIHMSCIHTARDAISKSCLIQRSQIRKNAYKFLDILELNLTRYSMLPHRTHLRLLHGLKQDDCPCQYAQWSQGIQQTIQHSCMCETGVQAKVSQPDDIKDESRHGKRNASFQMEAFYYRHHDQECNWQEAHDNIPSLAPCSYKGLCRSTSM
jgi:hypothetical protein